MFNKSKPSLDALERDQDFAFLKQKNDQLVKALIKMQSSHTKTQMDMDYIVKEKFLLEQKCIRWQRIVAEINARSRQCLNKIVECSTELTCMLNLIHEARDPQMDLESSHGEINGGLSRNEMMDNSPQNSVLNQKSAENEERSENQESSEELLQNVAETPQNNEENTQEEVESQNDFISRGGRSLSAESDWVIPDSDIELEENSDQECFNPIPEKLSVIDEYPEHSLSYHEDTEINGQNSNENSTSLFMQLPKTNINTRRAQHLSKNDDTDLSINVEADDSHLDNSRLDDCTFQNICRTTTPPMLSHESDKSPRKTTPKRSSFIKRKSIGSPCPKSLETRGSKKRKSFSPKAHRISASDHRKSRQSLILSSVLNSFNEENVPIRRKASARSSLFPPEPDSSVSPSGEKGPSTSKNLKEPDNSLGCRSIEDSSDSTLKSKIKEKGSPSEKSPTSAEYLSKMTDLISSTPIPFQDESEAGPSNINKKESKKKVNRFDASDSLDKSPLQKNKSFKNAIKKKSVSTNQNRIARMKNKNKDPEVDSNRISKDFSTSSRRMEKENTPFTDEHPSNIMMDDEDDGSPIVKRRKRLCTMYKYRPEDAFEEIITGVRKKRATEEYYNTLLVEQYRSMSQSNLSGTSFNRSKKCLDSTQKREESHMETPLSIEKKKNPSKKPENPTEQKEELQDERQDSKKQSYYNHRTSKDGDAQTSTNENKQKRGFKSDANHKEECTEDKIRISKDLSTSGKKIGGEKASLDDEHPSKNITDEDDDSPIVRRKKRSCTVYKLNPQDIFINGFENWDSCSGKSEKRDEKEEELPNDEPKMKKDSEYNCAASSKGNKKRGGAKAVARRKEEASEDRNSVEQPAETNETNDRRKRRAVKKIVYKEPSLHVNRIWGSKKLMRKKKN